MTAVRRLIAWLFPTLRPGKPCALHACNVCRHTVTALTAAQYAEVKAGRRAVCARRGCGGRLVRVDDLWLDPAFDEETPR